MNDASLNFGAESMFSPILFTHAFHSHQLPLLDSIAVNEIAVAMKKIRNLFK